MELKKRCINTAFPPLLSKELAGHNYKMMGGSETVSGDKDGVHTTAIHVPIGWQRRIEGGQVVYIRWVDSGILMCVCVS